MNRRILLPGLIGSHPLGALASCGLLRALTGWDCTAKLGFQMDDDWIAFVETGGVGSASLLVDRLSKWVKSELFDRVLDWADDVRVPVSDYRRILGKALSSGDAAFAQFLTALAADGAVDGQKALIKPSAFYMVSGQQSFLSGMKDIVAGVRSDPRAAFEEALLGPWLYRTPLHSLGWDPNTERLHALRSRAPTSEKPSCVAAAVLLGFWALPLFQTVSQEGRARTTGFFRENGDQFFAWPIFSTAIDFNELRSLLQVGEREWRSSGGVLRAGIEAIFRSRRSEFGQGYAVLRTAFEARY